MTELIKKLFKIPQGGGLNVYDSLTAINDAELGEGVVVMDASTGIAYIISQGEAISVTATSQLARKYVLPRLIPPTYDDAGMEDAVITQIQSSNISRGYS